MSALPLPPASTLRRPPRFPTAAAAILCVTGLVLFGQGVWIHAKALLAQVLLERAFAASLAGGRAVKPWSWADTWPVARIEVPRLHRSEIALAGSSGQALAFGPGHVERTPEPGEPGTSVFAAHRDTSFAFLGEVRIGDEVRVTRRDGRMLSLPRDRHLGRAVGCVRHRPRRRRAPPRARHLLAARCAGSPVRCATWCMPSLPTMSPDCREGARQHVRCRCARPLVGPAPAGACRCDRCSSSRSWRSRASMPSPAPTGSTSSSAAASGST